ncbi:MAG: glycerate kinase, partial [Dehalococcoidia bacterium]|nr:glycerate kinase [Dehalococcoidia bacterium]
MPQAFKGCLKAFDAASAMAEAVGRLLPDAQVLALPMADGGDDTLDVLMALDGGHTYTQEVTGPIGAPITAVWGVLADQKTAVIEMAQASGIRLMKPSERDPRVTTTFGTGELIKAALDRGYRKLLVGVGGSATVDGGAGAVTALGAR